MEMHIETTPNQFGFKPKHTTELCGFEFKSLLRLDTGRVVLIHQKRFELLTKGDQRNIAKCLLRVFSNIFNKQRVCNMIS